MDCIFCKIINGDVPSYKIYEDDKILAFLDINPLSPGHTLIIPKEHTLDITTIDNETLMHIMDNSRYIASLLMDKMGATGFTLTENNGSVQDVRHFHLHVIPKYTRKSKMSIEDVYNKLTK